MLLEVYRQQDDQASFETLAARFCKHFNVEPPTWDADAGQGTGTRMCLEKRFPHVVDRITALWPSSKCLDYLSGLLMDDLGGVRHGFSLDVAEEIELLRDIMRMQIGQGHAEQAQATPPVPTAKRTQAT